jgi:NAD(P)-dependent dehydrogenase (short-subunit alcohol dehydrogenase family)
MSSVVGVKEMLDKNYAASKAGVIGFQISGFRIRISYML